MQTPSDRKIKLFYKTCNYVIQKDSVNMKKPVPFTGLYFVCRLRHRKYNGNPHIAIETGRGNIEIELYETGSANSRFSQANPA